jgi:lactate dehydrogenase-like 2-hydroxyacid dehydrogenase
MKKSPEILLMGPYPPWDMQALEENYTVHRYWQAQSPETLLAQVGSGIQAIATSGHLGASRGLMQQLPALKLVACYGVGVDAIDLAAARELGVAVTNTPDVLTDDVADMAVVLLLSVLRRIPQGDRFVRSGQWPNGPMPLTQSLKNKRVGIAGLGRIGQAIATRLQGFGCSIAYSAREKKLAMPYRWTPNPLALAGEVDCLVVAVAGGAGTKHLVDEQVLRTLGPHGVVVNVSRGSTIDEEALLKLLASGELGAAGLDVFDNEPTINPAFFDLDNTVLAPHHASGTHQTRRAMGQLVRDNLAAYFAGKPLLTQVP